MSPAPLPTLRKPRTLTADQRAAMQRGRERKRKAREQERAREAARKLVALQADIRRAERESEQADRAAEKAFDAVERLSPRASSSTRARAEARFRDANQAAVDGTYRVLALYRERRQMEGGR